MNVGILALQGDFAAHEKILHQCGIEEVLAVRDASGLVPCEALIIPGGESTTMSRLCDRYELWQPLQERIASGMPVLGTCAGLIMLAKNISGGSRNFAQKTLGALDVDVARNAYGSQVESFETEIELIGAAPPMEVMFIRAPQITRVGDGVRVLASHNGAPVAVQQGKIIAAAFHPEIGGQTQLHQLWLDSFQH